MENVFTFPVIYEEAPEGGFVVSMPTLPGCHTQGETLEEAERNIKEAIEVYLESLQADGSGLPRESSVYQSMVKVAVPA